MTDHDVDDEERRGCQKCECDQFLAPPDPVLGGEPGTPEWWRSPGYMIHGPADTILRLLEQEEISRRKALELLAYLHCGAPQDLLHALPPAPWDKLNWCDDPSELETLHAAVQDAYEVIEDRAGGVVPGQTLAQQVEAMADRWGEALEGRDRARSLLAEVALWDSGALQGKAARTLLDRVRAFLVPT